MGGCLTATLRPSCFSTLLEMADVLAPGLTSECMIDYYCACLGYEL